MIMLFVGLVVIPLFFLSSFFFVWGHSIPMSFPSRRSLRSHRRSSLLSSSSRGGSVRYHQRRRRRSLSVRRRQKQKGG